MKAKFVSSLTGEKFSFDKHLNDLVRTQDIQGWIKRSPHDCNLQDWVIRQIEIKLRYSSLVLNK